MQALVREAKVGEQFEGTVKRILPFGAFVEILPGKEGMVHVSHMAQGFVKNPSDVVQIGQAVTVKVLEVDDQGRINLTMLLDEDPSAPSRQPQGDRRPAPVGAPSSSPRIEQKSDHPLSRQFRRERSGTPQNKWQRGTPQRGRKAHF